MKSTLSTSQTTVVDHAATHFMRRDFATAALVEQGIALQEQSGTKFAAVFLDYKGIPFDIALRVLLRPSERRKNYIADEPEPNFS